MFKPKKKVTVEDLKGLSKEAPSSVEEKKPVLTIFDLKPQQNNTVIKGFMVPNGYELQIETGGGTKTVAPGEYSGGNYSFQDVKDGMHEGWTLVQTQQAPQPTGMFGGLASKIKNALSGKKKNQQDSQHQPMMDMTEQIKQQKGKPKQSQYQDYPEPEEKEEAASDAWLADYSKEDIQLIADHMDNNVGINFYDAVQTGYLSKDGFDAILASMKPKAEASPLETLATLPKAMQYKLMKSVAAHEGYATSDIQTFVADGKLPVAVERALKKELAYEMPKEEASISKYKEVKDFLAPEDMDTLEEFFADTMGYYIPKMFDMGYSVYSVEGHLQDAIEYRKAKTEILDAAAAHDEAGAVKIASAVLGDMDIDDLTEVAAKAHKEGKVRQVKDALISSSPAKTVEEFLNQTSPEMHAEIADFMNENSISMDDLKVMSMAEFKSRFDPVLNPSKLYHEDHQITSDAKNKLMALAAKKFSKLVWDIPSMPLKDLLKDPELKEIWEEGIREKNWISNNTADVLYSSLPEEILDKLAEKDPMFASKPLADILTQYHKELPLDVIGHVSDLQDYPMPDYPLEKPSRIKMEEIPKFKIQDMSLAESRLHHLKNVVSGEAFDRAVEDIHTTSVLSMRTITDYVSQVIEDVVEERGGSKEQIEQIVYGWTSGSGGSQSKVGVAIRLLEAELQGRSEEDEFNIDKIRSGSFYFDYPSVQTEMDRIRDTYMAMREVHQDLFQSMYPEGKMVYRVMVIDAAKYGLKSHQHGELIMHEDMAPTINSLASFTVNEKVLENFVPVTGDYKPAEPVEIALQSHITHESVGINCMYHKTTPYRAPDSTGKFTTISRPHYNKYDNEREIVVASQLAEPDVLSAKKENGKIVFTLGLRHV